MTILIIYMTSRDALFAEVLGKPSLEKQQFFAKLNFNFNFNWVEYSINFVFFGPSHQDK